MIKAIIFDFAGVLTKENFLPALIKSLKKNFSFDEELFKKRFIENERAYMLDEIKPYEFWEKTCLDFPIPFEEFEKAFANSYELNSDILSLIEKLKNKYRIIMLTDNFNTLANKIKTEHRLNKLFEHIFFSNDIHYVKNEPGAFAYVLKKIREKAEECVFIDDKAENLVHAAKLGLKTIQFKGASPFITALRSLGVEA